MPSIETVPRPTNTATLSRKIVLVVAGIMVLSVLTYGGYKLYIYFLPRGTLDNNIYNVSLLGGKPEALQDSLVLDIKKGINDKDTKSAIYFIAHRYFDTGNIYEIYDYITDHPELSFLKEAESIYPEKFNLIKQKTMPPVYNDEAMYTLLAYFEAIDNHGYSDVAIYATAANQYAKLAYTIEKKAQEKAGQDISDQVLVDREKTIQRNIGKSIYFISKAQSEIAAILDGTFDMNSVPDRDILVGLNQYASALRYLELTNNAFSSQKSATEIFEFSRKFATEKVPELRLYTHLLDASTLVLVSPTSTEQIDIALAPIYTRDRTIPVTENSVIDKLIKSKNFPEMRTVQGETVFVPNYSVYAKRNMVMLAKVSPNLRAWLMSYNWEEEDFK